MPAPDWSRIANTTIHEYVRTETINVLRNRKILAKMKADGRISMGHAGDLLDWKVRYKRVPMQSYADMDTLTFARHDRHKVAQLDWRGYAATDAISKFEREKNKSTEAIIKLWSNMTAMLMDDVSDQFGDEIYVDGNAAGYTKSLHGLESMFASTTASSSSNAPVGVNGATYAGLVTTRGNYGGSWTTSATWPTGTGDAHFDFWSPLVIDYTSSITAANGGFASATATWAARNIEALRYGIIKGRKNKTKDGMLNLISLNDELYRLFQGSLQSEEQLFVQRGDKTGLYALGFGDVINFEGCDVTYEYGIPANVGYGLATEQMELCSLQNELFVADTPDFDPASRAWRFSIDFLGNMKMNPRYFCKWQAVGGT